MNNRLEIASRLLAAYATRADTVNEKASVQVQHALLVADALIALERETRKEVQP